MSVLTTPDPAPDGVRGEALVSPTLDGDATFTRWSSSRAAHPDALGPEDFDEVTRAGTAFARKVSGAAGAQLCDLLEESVLRSALVPVRDRGKLTSLVVRLT